jgi:hydroxyacylglutathione hydrolase
LIPQVVVLDVRYRAMKNYNYLVVDPASAQSVIVDPAWEPEVIDRAVAESGSRLRGVLVTHAHPDHTHLAERVSEQYDCPIWMSSAEIAASGFRARRLAGIDMTPWRIGDNVFTGDVLFAEGCGMVPDVPAAHAMFESLELLKARIPDEARVFPGHSYGQIPGRTMSQVRRENIYLQFSKKETFAAFRLRSGQGRARLFSFH